MKKLIIMLLLCAIFGLFLSGCTKKSCYPSDPYCDLDEHGFPQGFAEKAFNFNLDDKTNKQTNIPKQQPQIQKKDDVKVYTTVSGERFIIDPKDPTKLIFISAESSNLGDGTETSILLFIKNFIIWFIIGFIPFIIIASIMSHKNKNVFKGLKK